LFDGTWGGEDNFISHSIFRTGGYILMCSDDCFVNHFYHEDSPRDNRKKSQILKNLSRRLEQHILRNDIEGPIQNIKKGFHIYFGENDYKNELKNIVDIQNIDQEILNIVEWICLEYGYVSWKTIWKFFLTRNCKFFVEDGSVSNFSDYDISFFKELLGYVKIYLKDDKLEFVDDVSKFSKKVSDNSFLDYR
jgi:uncharacterized protein YeeX (DUF496 family)